MSLTADDVYRSVKSIEATFPLPAPYFTVDVGTLDAATGVFRGLSTTTQFDPEPIPHDPDDHPRNPPPRFAGDRHVSVTLDERFRQTITSEPAPHVPLAPVLVRFSVTNASTAWSVTVNGVAVSAHAAQSSILVDVWDAEAATWSITIGPVSRKDIVRFQRPRGPLSSALGAFTIPVLPLTIVYAPPVDSLGASSATYSSAQTVGSTVHFELTKDVSSTVPVSGSRFLTELSGLKASLDLEAKVLKASGAPTLSKVFSEVSSQIGQITATEQTGVTDGTESTITLTRSTSDELRATVANGGPGVGDVLHFYRNLRMVWSYVDGRLRLCPISYTEAFFTAAGLRDHAESIGISAAEAEALLALDPFTGPAGQNALPTDRFTFKETLEYGFGGPMNRKESMTRDTKRQTTQRKYTTKSSSWDAGPILEALFDVDDGTDTTTVTLTNALGQETSSTVTIEFDLVAGPEDHFVINVWYDNLFGTFAFEPLTPGTRVKHEGIGSGPAQEVVMRAGGKVFRTVTGPDGRFQFRAPNIPSGNATLSVGGVSHSVTI